MLVGGTLGLYLSRQFARAIFAVFATVFVLVYMIDFVELMRRAGDAEGATPGVMARLALFRTPAVTEHVLPFAVLFGSMAALLQLSRRLELVVARAAGISAWQFLQPGIGVALLIGIVAVAAYNPLSARLKQRASEIEAGIFVRANRPTSGNDVWLRQKGADGHAIVRAEASVDVDAKLVGVTVFSFDDAGRFLERIEARDAVLREGYWELSEARVLTQGEEPQSFGTYLIASYLERGQVRQSFTPPETVPFWQLDETIAQTERAGLDATRYRLHYDALLARPLLFVAMVLVAASVSLRFFRFGGVSRMVLSGVAAGFLLYVGTRVMEDLGGSGMLTPVVAAWFPAVVGSLLGTLALLYQEDG